MGERWGLPYKGSKAGIAQWVVSELPKKKNFYDLFAGGCAITHAALKEGLWQNYYCNDIADVPQLFMDAISGRYHDEKRWISREDFYRLKDKEPYIKYCWSFGNNGDNYLYSREVEPWKKALHYARVFGDYSEFHKMGLKICDASRIAIKQSMEEFKQKYIIWYCKEVLKSSLDVLELQKNLTERIERNSEELRNYLLTGLKNAGKRPCDVDKYLGTNGMAGHYFGKSQWVFPTREVYVKLQSFLDLPLEYEKIYGLQDLLQRLESLQRLQSLERLERLQSLQSLERLERLKLSRLSYTEVKIEPDSVIYCDIPYRNTDSYNNTEFDHEAFYSWAEKQTEPVYISEYWMPPERFECIAEIDKTVTYSSGAGNKAIEKLFVPKTQIRSGLYEQHRKQKYLF